MTSAPRNFDRTNAPLGRVLMVQGTSSHAGKTTLVAALCRLFANAGYRVAPFKAQNMSNNAAVTIDGGEVGRAQAMQAMAARIPVTVDMNPVLLKPQSDRTSQVVVLGKARYVKDAREYFDLKSQLWPVVTGALDRLRAAHDIVVIEGAGSPAEINLAQYDIVNMRVARYANAPVLLVGDIDRGGVFAALYGTIALLQPEERALVRGFIINKFRGDPSLLDPGFAMLLERTGIHTLGVLPHLDLSRIPAEDALEWDTLRASAAEATIDIAVMRLPRVANLDEFQSLAVEPGVRVRFVASPDDFGSPDLVIIPGTKSTLADLEWLRARGLAATIQARRAAGTPVLGICGGFQMLGDAVVDQHGAESAGASPGLGLLPMTTVFEPDKVTRQVRVTVVGGASLWHPDDAAHESAGSLGASELVGYEIHMGRSSPVSSSVALPPSLMIAPISGEAPSSDGFTSEDGLVVGTYVHGLLENVALRRALLRRLAARKGVRLAEPEHSTTIDDALDALATVVRRNMSLDAVAEMAGLALGGS